MGYSRPYLGQIPFDIPSAIATYAATSPAPAQSPSPPSCSTWDFFFNSAAWKACQNALAVAQIQQVANNAATSYGAGSQTAQVAQQVAAQQEALVPLDTQNIASYYGAGTLLATPGSSPQGQAGMPTWAVAGLIVAGFLLLRNI